MVTSRYTVHWRLDVLVQAYHLLNLLHSQRQMHRSVLLNPSRVGVQLIGRVPWPMREQLAIKLAEILNLVTSSNIERVGNVFSCSVITVTTLHLYKRGHRQNLASHIRWAICGKNTQSLRWSVPKITLGTPSWPYHLIFNASSLRMHAFWDPPQGVCRAPPTGSQSINRPWNWLGNAWSSFIPMMPYASKISYIHCTAPCFGSSILANQARRPETRPQSLSRQAASALGSLPCRLSLHFLHQLLLPLPCQSQSCHHLCQTLTALTEQKPLPCGPETTQKSHLLAAMPWTNKLWTLPSLSQPWPSSSRKMMPPKVVCWHHWGRKLESGYL